jgi:hypothetical protein
MLLSLNFGYKKMQQWRDLKALKYRIQQARDAHTLRLILLNKGQFKTLKNWADDIETSNSIMLKNLLNQACYQAPKEINLSSLKMLMLKSF